jgi:hypothetical protein
LSISERLIRRVGRAHTLSAESVERLPTERR